MYLAERSETDIENILLPKVIQVRKVKRCPICFPFESGSSCDQLKWFRNLNWQVWIHSGTKPRKPGKVVLWAAERMKDWLPCHLNRILGRLPRSRFTTEMGYSQAQELYWSNISRAETTQQRPWSLIRLVSATCWNFTHKTQQWSNLGVHQSGLCRQNSN